MLNTCS